MDKQEQGGVSESSTLGVADSHKLTRCRWAIRDILQYLKSERRVPIKRVEKAVQRLDEASFGESAKMLEAEFQPVFCGRKSTPELLSFVQRIFDSVDTAISQRMNGEICPEPNNDGATNETIETAYQYAFELIGLLRQASLCSDRLPSISCDSAKREQAADATEELAARLWDKLTGLRDVFKPTDPMRRQSYASIGPCQFRLGDFQTAYESAVTGETPQPVLPCTNTDGDYWVEATLMNAGHETHRWLMQLRLCCFVDTKAVILMTENYNRCNALRAACPFSNELDGLLRDRLMREQSRLLLDCREVTPQPAVATSTGKPKRTRKKKPLTERTTPEIILAFLRLWHKYPGDNLNTTSIVVKQFPAWCKEQPGAENVRINPTAVTRFLQAKFPKTKHAHTKYKQICDDPDPEVLRIFLDNDISKLKERPLPNNYEPSTLDDEPDFDL